MRTITTILLFSVAALFGAEPLEWQVREATITALKPFSPTQARIVCRYPGDPYCSETAGRIAYALDKAKWRVAGRTSAVRDYRRGTIGVTNSPGFTNRPVEIRSDFRGVIIYTNDPIKDYIGGQPTSALGAGAGLAAELKRHGIATRTLPASTNLPGRSILILVGKP